MLSDREQRQLLRNTNLLASGIKLRAYIWYGILALVFVIPLMLGLLAGLMNLFLGNPFNGVVSQ